MKLAFKIRHGKKQIDCPSCGWEWDNHSNSCILKYSKRPPDTLTCMVCDVCGSREDLVVSSTGAGSCLSCGGWCEEVIDNEEAV